jgi:hypothetical protein
MNNYFLHDYMIIQINACKIEYQLNVGKLIWGWSNLIGSKLKQIRKPNFQLTQVNLSDT